MNYNAIKNIQAIENNEIVNDRQKIIIITNKAIIMKTRFVISLIMCVLLSQPVFSDTFNKVISKKNSLSKKTYILSGKAFVRFKSNSGLLNSIKSSSVNSVDFKIEKPLLTENQSVHFNKALSQAFLPSKAVEIEAAEEPLLRTYTITFDNGIDPEKYCIQLKSLYPDIEIAEPYRLPRIQAQPNDAYSSQQQALTIVKAFEAFDIWQGDPSVVIGISDDGCNQQHPDLTESIARNTSEIPENGVDDDGNGYTDDYEGYNFAAAEGGSSYGNTFFGYSTHGTHVAGIAAATTNNTIGVASSGNKCKFFPIRGASNPDGQDIYVVYGYPSIIYAAVRGFKVLNCSWGDEKEPSPIEQSVIDFAVARDVAIVAAAGNGNNAYYEYYPAAYRGVLGVGEVDVLDQVVTSTSLGEHLKIMAPGTGNWSTDNSNDYDLMDGGTSYSSPLVAGALGLVRSKYTTLTALQSIEFIRQMSDDITSENEDIHFKNLIPGRLNMLKAMQIDPMSIPGISPIEVTYTNPVNGTINRFAVGDSILMRIRIHNYLGAASNLKFTLSTPYNPDLAAEVKDSIVNLGCYRHKRRS